jgi:hypothetical protein
LVAVANAVADGHVTVVPEVLVTGGGGSLDGLAATLMRSLTGGAAAGPDDSVGATVTLVDTTDQEPSAVVVLDAEVPDPTAEPDVRPEP